MFFRRPEGGEEGWPGKGLKCGLDPKVATRRLSSGRDLVVPSSGGERDFGTGLPRTSQSPLPGDRRW